MQGGYILRLIESMQNKVGVTGKPYSEPTPLSYEDKRQEITEVIKWKKH